MFCPKCGSEVADDTSFCACCGATLHPTESTDSNVNAAPAANAVPPIPEQSAAQTAGSQNTDGKKKIDTDAVKQTASNAWHSVKTFAIGLWAKIKPAVAPVVEKVKPYLKNKYVLGGIGGAVALVLILCIVLGIANSGNGFISHDHHYYAHAHDDSIYIFRDGKMLKDKIDGSDVSKVAASLDGNVFAFQIDRERLISVTGSKYTVVAEEVGGFDISVNGQGIVYSDKEGDETVLKLYNTKNGKSKVIKENCKGLDSVVISPDGKTVSYLMEDEDGESTLYYFDGSKSIKIASNDMSLVGMSNKGKYIYVISEKEGGNVLYVYNTKSEKESLGSISSSRISFNVDHTQVMFYSEGKTYISTKGHPAEKVSSYEIRLLLTNDAIDFRVRRSLTHPVKSLYKHVYVGVDSKDNTSAWYIHSNSDKSSKLVPNIELPSLDQSGEYLYYCSNDELRVIKISDGDSASEKYKVIGSDVDYYVITSDRSKAYCISNDGLYSCNAKNGSKKQIIASDDVEWELGINRKDVVYYNIDGNVYATSNGKKGKKVASDIVDMMTTSNGIVYALSDDAIYASTGSKKLHKLWQDN